MSGRRAIWEVARRELVERSRSRAMRISVVLVLVLAVGGAIAAARVGRRQRPPTMSASSARARRRWRRRCVSRPERPGAASASTAWATWRPPQRAVDDGRVDVALVDGSRLIVRSRAVRPGGERRPGRRRRPAHVHALAGPRAHAGAGARDAGAASAADRRARAARARGRPGAPVRRAPGALHRAGRFGNAVAVSVTEEKSSRVVELLLTTMSPRRLLTGKVLGIGLLGVAQLAVTGAAALAAGTSRRRCRPAIGCDRNGGARRPLVPARIRLLQRRVRGGGSAGVASGGPVRRVGADHRRPRRHLLALDAGRRLRSGTRTRRWRRSPRSCRRLRP